MKLTREQVIAEHRKMWRWIAEQYEKMDYMGCLSPRQLKEIYICEKGYDFFLICRSCFLCEYTGGLECNKCPLDWGVSQDCVGDYKNKGLYRQINQCYWEGDFKKCAELAHQIAELPEKQ